MTTESDEEPNVTFIEEYDNLESALSSKYADFFRKLDKMTADVKNKVEQYEKHLKNQ